MQLAGQLTGIDIDVDTRFVFAKLNLPLESGSRLYLMLGRTDVELVEDISTSGTLLDDSDTGIGVGFQMPIGTSDFTFGLDYIQYFDDDGIDISGINFNFIGYF